MNTKWIEIIDIVKLLGLFGYDTVVRTIILIYQKYYFNINSYFCIS